jgi:prepilin-type N-terminal cleavage/methylation domain-containing protein
MMHRRASQMLRGEDGFTLVELLVVIVISTALTFATLQTLDGFSSNAARQTRLIDADDEARMIMDRLVNDVRQASAVTRAGATDLVYAVSDSPTVTRYVRICIDGSGGLWSSQSTTSSSPGTSCPAVATGWSGARLTTRTSANTTANPIFTYDSATPSAVGSVGLNVSLDATSGAKAAVSTLRASASLRTRAQRAPVVTPGDIQTTCTSSGPLLNFGLLSNLLNGPLSISYTNQNGVALGSGNSLQLTNGVSSVVATITNAVGLTTVVNKDVSCN